MISEYRWFPEVIVALETAHYERVDNMLLLMGLTRWPVDPRKAKAFTIRRTGNEYSPTRMLSPSSTLQIWAAEAAYLSKVLKHFDASGGLK